MLRFALAEHKASCAFGEAGFVPSHTLARTPPARAVASSFPTTDQQESPIGLRGLRSLQRAQPDDAELASLEPLTWSPLRAEEYVSQTLGLPRVGSLLARRHVNGATLAAMSRNDLVRPEPQGLGLAAAAAMALILVPLSRGLARKACEALGLRLLVPHPASSRTKRRNACKSIGFVCKFLCYKRITARAQSCARGELGAF